MLRVRDYSITSKLTWMNMLVSGAGLLLAGAAFLGYELVTVRHDMVQGLSVQAQTIGFNSASALLFDDPHSAEGTLAALKAAPHIISAEIYKPDGRPFAAGSMTEDYELGLKLGALGLKTIVGCSIIGIGESPGRY